MTDHDAAFLADEKVYPRSVKGRYASLRWVMVWATQALYYGLPWLTWGERPAVLFDLLERRFYVFGLVLWPPDLVYLAALLIASALLLFLVTAIAGRLWCGFACPQTVYTEIFLWLERMTEGDRGARVALDAAPMGWRKLWRKGAKHVLWLAVAFYTGFTFLGYFTPIRELAHRALALEWSAWETFWVCFYGFATYGNAGWMREQICKYMCPYARFQSTLIEPRSLVIAYDRGRGDPRGARSRKADARALGLGDCVNCTLCVQVCPTGIDIRKGLQNECISCAACIDVCDGVMDKLGYRRGLIRFATADADPAFSGDAVSRAAALGRGRRPEDATTSDGRRVARVRATLGALARRPRVVLYALALVVTVGGVATGLSRRDPFTLVVLRDRGTLARLTDEGDVVNVYRLKLSNRTEHPLRYRVSAEGLSGVRVERIEALDAPAAGIRESSVRVVLPASSVVGVAPGSHAIAFVVRAGEDLRPVREASTFLVPRP